MNVAKRQRISFRFKHIFVDYKRKSTTFRNKHMGNNHWHIQEYWYAFIGFSPHFYKKEDLYYDGHTDLIITFLGISFGYGYTYDSRPIENWLDDEELF